MTKHNVNRLNFGWRRLALIAGLIFYSFATPSHAAQFCGMEFKLRSLIAKAHARFRPKPRWSTLEVLKESTPPVFYRERRTGYPAAPINDVDAYAIEMYFSYPEIAVDPFGAEAFLRNKFRVTDLESSRATSCYQNVLFGLRALASFDSGRAFDAGLTLLRHLLPNEKSGNYFELISLIAQIGERTRTPQVAKRFIDTSYHSLWPAVLIWDRDFSAVFQTLLISASEEPAVNRPDPRQVSELLLYPFFYHRRRALAFPGNSIERERAGNYIEVGYGYFSRIQDTATAAEHRALIEFRHLAWFTSSRSDPP